MTTIIPVVLCGGTGTRLWPVSREGMAKQLLPIVGEETLLQMTLRRAAGEGFGPPMVIGAYAVRFTIREQVQAVAKTYFGDDGLTVGVLDPQPLPDKPRRPAAPARHGEALR